MHIAGHTLSSTEPIAWHSRGTDWTDREVARPVGPASESPGISGQLESRFQFLGHEGSSSRWADLHQWPRYWQSLRTHRGLVGLYTWSSGWALWRFLLRILWEPQMDYLSTEWTAGLQRETCLWWVPMLCCWLSFDSSQEYYSCRGWWCRNLTPWSPSQRESYRIAESDRNRWGSEC